MASGHHYKGGEGMKHIDRLGVYILMSHLIITLAFIGVYAYTLVTGQEDETLRTILTVIVGYWFGALGKDAIRKTQNTIRRKDEQEAS